MSRKAIEKFYLLISQDEKVKAQIDKLDQEYPIQVPEVDEEALAFLVEKEIIPIAMSRGLSFTSKEFMNFLNEKRKMLEEDEFSGVGGGISPKQAIIGLSGVLLLSAGAGAGVLSIAKSIDKPTQKINQQLIFNRTEKSKKKADEINIFKGKKSSILNKDKLFQK